MDTSGELGFTANGKVSSKKRLRLFGFAKIAVGSHVVVAPSRPVRVLGAPMSGKGTHARQVESITPNPFIFGQWPRM